MEIAAVVVLLANQLPKTRRPSGGATGSLTQPSRHRREVADLSEVKAAPIRSATARRG
jgi:hypothetical protein